MNKLSILNLNICTTHRMEFYKEFNYETKKCNEIKKHLSKQKNS